MRKSRNACGTRAPDRPQPPGAGHRSSEAPSTVPVASASQMNANHQQGRQVACYCKLLSIKSCCIEVLLGCLQFRSLSGSRKCGIESGPGGSPDCSDASATANQE